MECISLTETKYILKSLVMSSTFEMTIDRLNNDYYREMGYSIPFRKFGFRNILQFLNSIADTIRVKQGRNPLVYVAPSEKTQHMEKLSSIKKNVTKVRNYDAKKQFPTPCNQKFQFKSLNLRVESNISQNIVQTKLCESIDTDIKSNIKCDNVIDKNGTTSKIICTDLESNIKCDEEIYRNGATDFNYVNTSINSNNVIPNASFSEPFKFTNEALPDISKNDAIFLLDFPKNTVKFGTQIESYEISLDLKDGDVFAIFVTEIHNPYKFWFHIAKQNDELDEMMEGLKNFYENSGQEFIMKLSNIIPGQICAAPYSGLWHRAEIIGLPLNGKVKVCFVDYGTVYNVPVKCIRYLPTEFSKLNKQALRGCLSGIRPSGLRWSRDSTYSFLDMVADKLLYAKVTQILREEKVIHILLTDTNYDRDFHINSALMGRGHAKRHDEATFKLCEKNHYPTFKMLENGEYPTFHEIGILLAQGIDYEAKVYNNIICDVVARKCTLEEYLQKLTSYNIIRKN